MVLLAAVAAGVARSSRELSAAIAAGRVEWQTRPAEPRDSVGTSPSRTAVSEDVPRLSTGGHVGTLLRHALLLCTGAGDATG